MMMNLKNLFIPIIFIGSITLMSSCAPSTNIIASWDNPEVEDEAYKNVLITAMVDDISSRQVLEDELLDELEDIGVKATKSVDIFPPKLEEDKRTKAELLDAIEENQFDAVITIALIDKESEARYVPGNSMYAPLNFYGYYGTFWGYYNFWYPQMYNTGYYDVDRSYFIETNLYDAETEKLMWSAQSKTVNPVSLEDFADDYSEKISENMLKENILGTE